MEPGLSSSWDRPELIYNLDEDLLLVLMVDMSQVEMCTNKQPKHEMSAKTSAPKSVSRLHSGPWLACAACGDERSWQSLGSPPAGACQNQR